jgi:hypothetical protein
MPISLSFDIVALAVLLIRDLDNKANICMVLKAVYIELKL